MAVKKIMVVDDSPTQRYFMMDLLTKNGFNVVAVETGEEALAKVKQEMPDLIVMDVVMPGQNGFQTTRAITKDPETENIPVIMCTSKSQETDKIWGLRQGARDYLVKPVEPDELIKKIKTLLAS
ncbi:response regulator transcription factor [Parvibium lacunae]|uniref:Response regulator n=1 Tax=Parvibium lacunae TaxID=1888893 RepID=A0A368L4N0_9BURK|nr:response regulator [Parvibium lacunae]RCS58527.1 response regulator [Parvibium lacunae]